MLYCTSNLFCKLGIKQKTGIPFLSQASLCTIMLTDTLSLKTHYFQCIFCCARLHQHTLNTMPSPEPTLALSSRLLQRGLELASETEQIHPFYHAATIPS